MRAEFDPMSMTASVDSTAAISLERPRAGAASIGSTDFSEFRAVR
jgi:hypothetical protein